MSDCNITNNFNNDALNATHCGLYGFCDSAGPGRRAGRPASPTRIHLAKPALGALGPTSSPPPSTKCEQNYHICSYDLLTTCV